MPASGFFVLLGKKGSMSSNQLGVPKGTRDFGPETMVRRHFILDHIRRTFEKYAFQPLETPAMEQLSVLTGKYGDEGDQLIFKILDSGDFLKKTQPQDYQNGWAQLLPKISQKALRYDLTVPFARYVAMHRHEITFPFKRYQMQPVWRADRPQKSRYREFMQCDADVVGTNSLLCEAEIVTMIYEVFQGLGIDDFTILINHRKILTGMAEAMGAPGRESDIAVSIDKIHKVGVDKVEEELKNKGIPGNITDLLSWTTWRGNWQELKDPVSGVLKDTTNGPQGMEDLDEIHQLLQKLKFENSKLQFDASLARGLSYYTGIIFEVVVNNVNMGSVSGGGRYDDLTGVFGLPDISGVGISFGVDRIYDVMAQLDLFSNTHRRLTEVLIVSLDVHSQELALELLNRLRAAEISSELYPDLVKLKKSLAYADRNHIPRVVLIGSNEVESGQLTLKNMNEGTQEQITVDELMVKLGSK